MFSAPTNGVRQRSARAGEGGGVYKTLVYSTLRLRGFTHELCDVLLSTRQRGG